MQSCTRSSSARRGRRSPQKFLKAGAVGIPPSRDTDRLIGTGLSKEVIRSDHGPSILSNCRAWSDEGLISNARRTAVSASLRRPNRARMVARA